MQDGSLRTDFLCHLWFAGCALAGRAGPRDDAPAPAWSRSRARAGSRKASRGPTPGRTGRHGAALRPAGIAADGPASYAVSAFTPKCPCPRRAGRSTGGRAVRRARDGEVCRGCGIPSTSPRATTRHPGRRLGRIGGGWSGCCARGAAGSGLHQVDGMPHEPRSGGSAPANRRRRSRRPVAS